MTALKFAQFLTAATALACLAFGFGTAWFVVGMFALIASVTVWGLAHAVDDDGDGHCTACDHPFGNVRHICVGGETSKDHGPPVVIFRGAPKWQHVEGGKRPTWPSEIGGVE
jgi:hypothetical protein